MTRKLSRLTLVALWITLASACSPSPAPAAPAAGVPWGDYAPSVKTNVDAAARGGDCAELQAAFDAADANNAATLSRTGHNNAELMKYIDGKMAAAGCY